MNFFRILKKNIETRWWIRSKRREIKDKLKIIELQTALFKMSAARLGKGHGDGTADFSVMHLYQLRGEALVVIGTSVYTHQQLRSSLHKGTLALNRFERRFKNGTLEIKNTDGELRRKKQEAFTAQSNGIQIFEGNVSIPD